MLITQKGTHMCSLQKRQPTRANYTAQRLSHVLLFATPRTLACQAPLSMGFSRQEYWSGLPCPPPGDLPDPGIEFMSLASPALQADSLPTEPPGKPLYTNRASHLTLTTVQVSRITVAVGCPADHAAREQYLTYNRNPVTNF